MHIVVRIYYPGSCTIQVLSSLRYTHTTHPWIGTVVPINSRRKSVGSPDRARTLVVV